MKKTVNILSLEPTEDSPRVYLDTGSGSITCSGTAIPENSEEYYGPILDWLADFVETDPEKVEVNFKLDYFNTSSSKYILEMLRTLERLAQNGRVIIRWHYLMEDEDMKEAGEDYQIMVKIPFELVEYEE
jgi:hypothetical protein